MSNHKVVGQIPPGLTEAKRERRMLIGFNAIIVPVLFAYGIYDHFFGPQIAIGLVELVFASALSLNMAAFWMGWYGLRPAKSVFTSLIIVVLLATILDAEGGTYGTAIYWLFAFPPAAFLLNGLKRGLFFNAVFFLCTAALAVAQEAGMIATHYSLGEYQQFWIAAAVVVAMGISAEMAGDGFRETIVAQSEELRVLLSSLPVGVVMADSANGLPIASNEMAEKLLGHPVSRQVPVSDFSKSYDLMLESGSPVPPADLPLSMALAGTNGVSASDMFIARTDGSRAAIRMTAVPVRDDRGKVMAAVAVLDDMTKEYELSQMKSEFTSFTSHQLKNPLTEITWSLESMLEGDGGKLEKGQEEGIRRILEVVAKISRLVTDLLMVSKLDALKESTTIKERTDLRPIISAAIRDLGTYAVKSGVSVEVKDLPERILRRADGIRMREVFANLIGNAIKYSKTGGMVTVGYSMETPYGEAIFVKDSGIGIPRRAQSKVFEKFFRAENTEEKEGTGLGLYITREIVNRHGGRIWFDSEEGKGTTFFLHLPDKKET